MIRFRLLGSVDLRDEDGKEVRGVLAQPKRLALLAYLTIATRLGTSRRDTLLGLFWPELDQDRARNALNKAVYFLRQMLGDNVVVSRSADELAINCDRLWCDVRAFDEAVAAQDHETTSELYRGNLLAGLFLGDNREFEEWLDGERTSRKGQYVAALEELANQATGRGDHTRVVDLLRTIYSVQLSGRTAYRLAGALASLGDREGALAFGAQHAAKTRVELGVEPDPSFIALCEQLRVSARRVQPRVQPNDDVAGAQSIESSLPIGPADARTRRSKRQYSATIASLAVGGGLVAWLAMNALGLGENRKQALILLPFENRTGDSTKHYLAEGIEVALAQQLSIISGLRLTSRESAVPYTRYPHSARDIAIDAGVDAALSASLLRAGDTVAVRVTIVRAQQQNTWTQLFEIPAAQVFELHHEIAKAVANSLRVRLTSYDLEQLGSKLTVKAVAYDLWLRGSYHARRRTRTHVEACSLYAGAAATADPAFRQAYELISACAWQHAVITRAESEDSTGSGIRPGAECSSLLTTNDEIIFRCPRHPPQRQSR